MEDQTSLHDTPGPVTVVSVWVPESDTVPGVGVLIIGVVTTSEGGVGVGSTGGEGEVSSFERDSLDVGVTPGVVGGPVVGVVGVLIGGVGEVGGRGVVPGVGGGVGGKSGGDIGGGGEGGGVLGGDGGIVGGVGGRVGGSGGGEGGGGLTGGTGEGGGSGAGEGGGLAGGSGEGTGGGGADGPGGGGADGPGGGRVAPPPSSVPCLRCRGIALTRNVLRANRLANFNKRTFDIIQNVRVRVLPKLTVVPVPVVTHFL